VNFNTFQVTSGTSHSSSRSSSTSRCPTRAAGNYVPSGLKWLYFLMNFNTFQRADQRSNCVSTAVGFEILVFPYEFQYFSKSRPALKLRLDSRRVWNVCISLWISILFKEQTSAQIASRQPSGLKCLYFPTNFNDSVPAGNVKRDKSMNPRAVRGSESLIFHCFYR